MLNTYLSACVIEYITGIAVSDCDLKSLGDVLGISLLSKNVTFDATMTSVDFKTQWEDNVVQGHIIPLKQIYNFVQNTAENEVATSSLGIKTKIRDGKPDFTFTYDRSHCFDNQLSKLMVKEWDIVFHMSKGLLLTTDVTGAKLKGFDVGYSDKSTFKLQQGTDPQSSTVMFQFSSTGTDEFNRRKKVLDVTTLGFDPFNLNGITQLDISIESGIADSSTKVSVNVVNACSGLPVTGLGDTIYWGVERNGGNSIDQVVDEGAGKYLIKFADGLFIDETIRFYLTDGTYNTIITPLGVIYTGSTPTVTVI